MTETRTPYAGATVRRSVYIAGPYTLGNQADNVRLAVQAAERLIALGFEAYVPHLTHLWHLISPHEWSFWMHRDLYWLARCDCVIRLPGESVGADVEVQEARSIGMPVFESIAEVLAAWSG